jgi:hypothetical protein
MAETRLVVEHREQLWSLLIEAAQFEHMIMCQYLYACFSLRTEPDEGLTAEQADAIARWQGTMTGIAIEEMLHLALVNNVMTAIGAAPSLARPNFPRHSEFWAYSIAGEHDRGGLRRVGAEAASPLAETASDLGPN